MHIRTIDAGDSHSKLNIRKLMKTVHVSKCGRKTELKSSMNVRENVHAKMLT